MREAPILIDKQGDDYLQFHGTEHVALYAKTGSGKTSGCVVPNCLTWPGSLVVLDIKGEAFRDTAGYRSQVLGQEVYVFDPAASRATSNACVPSCGCSSTSS
jgi:type IV secretion system protein VirD4